MQDKFAKPVNLLHLAYKFSLVYKTSQIKYQIKYRDTRGTLQIWLAACVVKVILVVQRAFPDVKHVQNV